MIKDLPNALAEFDEDFVLETLKASLKSESNPLGLLKQLQEGMTIVGDRYNKGEYYLSDLMLSGDLFQRAMQILAPFLNETSGSDCVGRILLGTPRGDIHNLGKDIFGSLARGYGFEIIDLGVNVPVEKFVEAVQEIKPDILGFSALITPAYEPIKEVVDLLVEQNLRNSLKIIVGGGVVTATVSEFVGADGYTNDAMDGLKQCLAFMGIAG